MRKPNLIDPADVLPLVLAHSHIRVSLRRFKAWFEHGPVPGKYWDGRKWWIRRRAWDDMVKRGKWDWIGAAAVAYSEYEKGLKDDRRAGRYANQNMVRRRRSALRRITVHRPDRSSHQGMGRVDRPIPGDLPSRLRMTRVEIEQPLLRLLRGTLWWQGRFVHCVRPDGFTSF